MEMSVTITPSGHLKLSSANQSWISLILVGIEGGSRKSGSNARMEDAVSGMVGGASPRGAHGKKPSGIHYGKNG
jgi:hypothetical protein